MSGVTASVRTPGERVTQNNSFMSNGPNQPGIAARDMMTLALPLVAAAGLLLMIPLALEDRSLALPAATAALVLFLSALMLVMRQFGQRLKQRLILEAAERLIATEGEAALVADGTGLILARNSAARARAGPESAAQLADLLAQVFADPVAILRSMQMRALAGERAEEEMMTRHGPLKVSTAAFGSGLFLWRLTRPPARARPHDDMAVPFLTAGPGGVILYMNAAFRHLVGGRARHLGDVIADLPLESGHHHVVKTTDGPVTCLVAAVDGSGGRCEVYLLPGASGALTGDWNRFGALPIPLLLLTPDGMILAANHAARTLLPMPVEPETRFADLVEGPGRPLADWLRDAADGRGGEQAQFLRGAGPYRDHFLRVTLSPCGSGDERKVIAILNDVTEYKTLEAQFAQSQKMEAIGQLAGGIAHDFNNLLTAISGHCDLLLLRRDESDPDYGDLSQILQNANRAAGLVAQLLAFSRKQSLTPEVIDLRDALADLTHLLNRLVGEKVHLTLEHGPVLRPIRADRRQLEQVIMNLVVNARDAMPGGGEIRIETENRYLDTPLERDRASVPAGDHVVVRVMDSGGGIPPERIGKIFEPFYTTKPAGEGTGLGLSTAYGIVKQTGGFIFVDSHPGTGTTFSLWFPACRAALEARPTSIRAVPPRVADQTVSTVLLVEDEAPVRAFAARALRLRGHNVIEVESAEAALSLLADPEFEVDIFLSDVVMAGKDGPTWVREALANRPDTRVVFVSGYASEGLSDHCTQIPGAVFLAKPFSLSDLADTVQSLAA